MKKTDYSQFSDPAVMARAAVWAGGGSTEDNPISLIEQRVLDTGEGDSDDVALAAGADSGYKIRMDIEAETENFSTGSRRAKMPPVRYDLVSPIGLRRLAETYHEGAVKYDDNNWRTGQPYSAVLNHLLSHVFQFMSRDASEDHLAHAAWGLFALMEFQVTHPEMDDRWLP